MRHLGVAALELKIQSDCCFSAIAGARLEKKSPAAAGRAEEPWGDPHWVVKEASNQKITPEVATSPINVR
jgi:hypothetical protein